MPFSNIFCISDFSLVSHKVFRLADHPPFTGPGFARAVAEVTETPGGLAGQAGLFHFFAQGLLQALVARQTPEHSPRRGSRTRP